MTHGPSFTTQRYSSNTQSFFTTLEEVGKLPLAISRKCKRSRDVDAMDITKSEQEDDEDERSEIFRT
jgi:hypothetical protein